MRTEHADASTFNFTAGASNALIPLAVVHLFAIVARFCSRAVQQLETRGAKQFATVLALRDEVPRQTLQQLRSHSIQAVILRSVSTA